MDLAPEAFDRLAMAEQLRLVERCEKYTGRRDPREPTAEEKLEGYYRQWGYWEWKALEEVNEEVGRVVCGRREIA